MADEDTRYGAEFREQVRDLVSDSYAGGEFRAAVQDVIASRDVTADERDALVEKVVENLESVVRKVIDENRAKTIALITVTAVVTGAVVRLAMMIK